MVYKLNQQNLKNKIMIDSKIYKDALNKAYKEAGHNAYFKNGFDAGVNFVLDYFKNIKFDSDSVKIDEVENHRYYVEIRNEYINIIDKWHTSSEIVDFRVGEKLWTKDGFEWYFSDEIKSEFNNRCYLMNNKI
jgi:hypothetical protein